MAISTLPAAPSRTSPATFADKADALLGALAGFVTEANALETNVNSKEVSAVASAAAALVSKNAAAVSEANAAAVTAAPKWVSGTTYAIGNCVWSPTDYGVYRRLTTGGGTTDPVSDTTNWAMVSVGPEFQNNLIAAVLAATDMAALANRELDRFRRVRIQEGETTIYNRGTISGCTVTRKSASFRLLSLALGVIFINGRSYSIDANTDAATVPANATASSATCSVYLYVNSGVIACGITALGTAAPTTGLVIYTITVPAGSTGDSDAFTITDARRVCPGWPNVFISPVYASIALAYVLPDANYAVHLDVVSCEGGRQQIGDLEVADRLTNGFKIYLGGAADAVCIRYTVRRMI